MRGSTLWDMGLLIGCEGRRVGQGSERARWARGSGHHTARTLWFAPVQKGGQSKYIPSSSVAGHDTTLMRSLTTQVIVSAAQCAMSETVPRGPGWFASHVYKNTSCFGFPFHPF